MVQEVGFWQHTMGASHSLEEAVSLRLGRNQDDFDVHLYASIILSVGLAVTRQWVNHPGEDWIRLFDVAINRLQNGLP
ncbi:hypothetical protein BXT84_12655 [Sulfobacillus thermotolerans]|uniref:MftR C-terminal domain-containing protein n=1 Tax=Sulfobacillus thermotolerans TaxID=338644 RepID=A0ABN5H1S5_9FIRM|nr:hypothetical protein BXT84_12655 [Sulfobacillus thermotolerans]